MISSFCNRNIPTKIRIQYYNEFWGHKISQTLNSYFSEVVLCKLRTSSTTVFNFKKKTTTNKQTNKTKQNKQTNKNKTKNLMAGGLFSRHCKVFLICFTYFFFIIVPDWKHRLENGIQVASVTLYLVNNKQLILTSPVVINRKSLLVL